MINKLAYYFLLVSGVICLLISIVVCIGIWLRIWGVYGLPVVELSSVMLVCVTLGIPWCTLNSRHVRIEISW
ncbi:MAG: hypothetical protein ABIM21_05395, partial [candidate division WOR-3 bacterium]